MAGCVEIYCHYTCVLSSNHSPTRLPFGKTVAITELDQFRCFKSASPRADAGRHKEARTMPTTTEFMRKYGPWALVTGASSGMGKEWCRSLASRGLNIAMAARRTPKLEELAAELKSKHSVDTRVLTADLSQPGAAAKLATGVEDLEIGMLINNAGVDAFGLFVGIAPEKLEQVMTLNMVSVALLARLVGRRIADRRSGGIIFTSSMGSMPQPFSGLYSSTKSFVTTLGVSMKYEMAEYGVDVLTFEPGPTQSEITARMNETTSMGDMGFQLMDTSVAVETCLKALGKADVCTPGFTNRVLKWFLANLPWWLTLPTMGGQMKKILPKEQTGIEKVE